MRISKLVCLLALLLPASVLAQGPGEPPPPDAGPVFRTEGSPGIRTKVVVAHEMGEWWRDSHVAKKLQLSDDQIAKLNQTFFDHRMKLIDYGANMEKEDLKLQSLLDADSPNESQVGTQVDQVLAARGKLEREFTMMNLDLRKVLTVDQWKQLRAMRDERGPGHNVFFRQVPSPGSDPAWIPPAPPPGPGGTGTF